MDFPNRDGWRYAVAVDVETTGLGAAARVVQVAALRFRWNEEGVVDFSPRLCVRSLVRPPPGTRFEPGAVAVTGIGPERVRSAPSFADVLPSLRRTWEGLPVVAHNAAFDRRMLKRELEAAGAGGEEPGDWRCTLGMARRAGHPSLRLGDVARRLGVSAGGELHDAGTDAELCARIAALLHLRSAPFPTPSRPIIWGASP